MICFLESTGVIFEGLPIFKRHDGKYPFDIVRNLLIPHSAAHSFIFDFEDPDSPFVDSRYQLFKSQVGQISNKFQEEIKAIEEKELDWMVEGILQNGVEMSKLYSRFRANKNYDLQYAWNVVNNFQMMFSEEVCSFFFKSFKFILV